MNWKLLFHTLVCGLAITWWICHSPLNKWVVVVLGTISYVIGYFISRKLFSRKES